MSKQLKALSSYSAIIVFVIAMISLFGWFSNTPSLTLNLSMPFIVLSIMSSLALYLLTANKTDDLKILTAKILSITIIVFCGVILINHIFLDYIQVAIGSKIAFILIGISLLCISKNQDCIISKTSATTLFLYSLFNLIGNIYGFEITHSVLSHITISSSNAIVLSILGFGLLSARDDEWILGPLFSKYSGGQMARRLLPVFALIIFIGLIRHELEKFELYNSSFSITISVFLNLVIMFGALFIIARIMNKKDEIERENSDKLNLFRDLTDRANDAIYIIDFDTGKFIDVNQTACNSLGYLRTEFMNMRVTDIDCSPNFSWEDHTKKLKQTRAMILISEHKHKSGKIIPVEINTRYVNLNDKDYVVAFARDITERKEAEGNISELKKQIEFILGATKTGLDIIDLDFNIRYIDPEWEKILGKTENKKCYQYFMDRDSVCPDCGVKKALEHKRSFVTEEYLLKENNRPIQVTSIPYQDKNGEWLVAEVNTDISDRKIAEESLRESEEILRIMTENTRDVILMVDEFGLITFSNKPAESLFGISKQNLIGKNFKILVAGETNHDIFTKHFDELMAKGLELSTGKSFEFTATRTNGEDFPAEIAMSAIKIKGKWHAVFTIRDITEHVTRRKNLEVNVKESTLALKDSEERYKLLLQNANDAIILIDTNTGVIIETNPAMLKLTGKLANEILGHHFTDLHPASELELHKSKFSELINNKSSIFRNINLVHASGKLIPIQISASIIKILDKTLAQGIITDVSKYKEVEDSLTTQLEDARRLSDIGSLAATVAHELRNPLGVIRTAAYNINRKSKDPDLTKHLNNIEKKIIESDKIIKNLLSYSRIKLPHYEKVSPIEILNQSILECKDKHKTLDIQYLTKFNCEESSLIDADPIQISELFSNLIDNACQSFPTKEGIISISADYNKNDNLFTLTIEDNGEGIESDDLTKIFEPFFTRKARGIGLGLTVCGQVVHLHKGNIDITSKKSHGTTVIVKLPIEKPV